MDLDGQQEEGCPCERLTRVEYTRKVLGCDVQVDHAAVVTEVARFIVRQKVTDASIATKVGCAISEFRLWMKGEQACMQMERKYERLLQRVMRDFDA